MGINQKKEDNSSYQFIQEKIVSSRRKKWKKLLSSAGTALLMGLVFGVAASATFGLTKPWFTEEKEENFVEIDPEISGDSQTETDSPFVDEPLDSEQPDQQEGNPVTDGEGETEPNEGQEQDPNPEGEGVDGEVGPEGSGETDPSQESGTQITIVEQKIEASVADYQKMYREISLLAEEVNHSIVKVTSIQNGVDWFQNPYTTQEETSGLVLASDEENLYILVNHQHVEKAGSIQVSFDQGITTMATIHATEVDLNLAVLAVQKNTLPRKLANEIPVATLSEAYTINVGEPVMALGNPNGYPYSMLLGIVTDRDAYTYISDARISLFHTDIQLAENGDGYIVDMDGKVVGLITRTLGDTPELCTAVSSSRIRNILTKLVDQSPRIYSGIVGMDLTPELKEQLQVPGGVYITEVESGSPAALAGIRAGDVLLQVNEENVLTMASYATNIHNRVPQEVVTLQICRMVRTEAVMQEYTMTLAEKEK